jgi:hypothetical protein
MQRAARNETSREEKVASTSRSRELQEQNEAEGFSLVRSHRLPDGRHVTVYRRVLEDDDVGPAMAYSDTRRSRPLLPSPFSRGFPLSFW